MFTGDTLFIGGKFCSAVTPSIALGWEMLIVTLTLGCGRFFEGTSEEMDTALNKTLGSLPEDTKVYVRAVGDSHLLALMFG